MADRHTMNVSLPPGQDRFVREQVASGRYRTVSEVVRDGLRLLEEAEHRRLLEKWVLEDLAPHEHELLPEELRERVRLHFSSLVAEGVRSGQVDGWVDGPAAMKRLRERLESRFRSQP